jgi:hypothetical protein
MRPTDHGRIDAIMQPVCTRKEAVTVWMQNDIVDDTASMARFSRLVKRMAMSCKSRGTNPEN